VVLGPPPERDGRTHDRGKLINRKPAGMLQLTEALLEGASEIGGSFYLPYRLHARPDRVRRIYTGTDAFVEAKRRLDPRLVFRNALWDALDRYHWSASSPACS
jgi:hypothetical protein